MAKIINQHNNHVDAAYFVQANIHAANDAAREACENLRKELGLQNRTGTNAALYGFLQACKELEARDPYLGWLYRNSEGKNVEANATARDRLIEHDYISLLHKSFYDKFGDGQANIYLLNAAKVPDCTFMEFSCSSPERPVAIKTEKKSLQGNALKEAGLLEQYKIIEQNLRDLNSFLAQFPFKLNGTIFQGGLTRKFNSGRLDRGGRFYPSYVNRPKKITYPDGRVTHPRKEATIGGETVAEVDLKAAFPSILAAQKDAWWPEGLTDPYKLIPWVANGTGDERVFFKALVSAIIMKDGKLKKIPTKMQKNPTKKGEDNPDYEAILKKHKGRDLINACYAAFPFIRNCIGQEVVYWESEVIFRTMLNLKDKGIPAYPLHDSIFVRSSDKSVAAQELKATFRSLLGYTPIVASS